MNLEAKLPRLIERAMAAEMDRAALFGDPAGASGEPRGLFNVAGVGEVAHDAHLTSYRPLIGVMTAIKTANAGDPSAFVASPRDLGRLAELTASDGQPLQVPSNLASIPMLSTTAVPLDLGGEDDESVILCGNWAHFLIGVRESINVQVLRESFSATGEIGFLVHARIDFAVEQAAAFAKITGIIAGDPPPPAD